MEESEDDTRLVISSTSEFVRNLGTSILDVPIPVDTLPPPVQESIPQTIDHAPIEMPLDDPVTDIQIDEPKDIEMDEPGQVSSPPVDEDDRPDVEDQPSNSLTEEPLVSTGLAATLALLHQKRMLEPVDMIKEREMSQKNAWMIEQRRLDAQERKEKNEARKRNKALGEAGKGTQGTGAGASSSRDRINAVVERFKGYTPSVDIKYHDEDGRELNQKEAFRQMSHKFHGYTILSNRVGSRADARPWRSA